MRGLALSGIVLSIGLMLATPASAGYVVTTTNSYKLDADGVNYDYTITLTDAVASTSNIGTFWFAWVPGKDLMVNKPISEINPQGWTPTITGGGAGDGFAIQWVAGAANFAITPGNTLSFSFKSAETPAQLVGFSPTAPTLPEDTATVYSGRPFSDAGDQFVVAAPAAVPEPSSLMLMLLASLGLIARKGIVRLAWA